MWEQLRGDNPPQGSPRCFPARPIRILLARGRRCTARSDYAFGVIQPITWHQLLQAPGQLESIKGATAAYAKERIVRPLYFQHLVTFPLLDQLPPR